MPLRIKNTVRNVLNIAKFDHIELSDKKLFINKDTFLNDVLTEAKKRSEERKNGRISN